MCLNHRTDLYAGQVTISGLFWSFSKHLPPSQTLTFKPSLTESNDDVVTCCCCCCSNMWLLSSLLLLLSSSLLFQLVVAVGVVVTARCCSCSSFNNKKLLAHWRNHSNLARVFFASIVVPPKWLLLFSTMAFFVFRFDPWPCAVKKFFN